MTHGLLLHVYSVCFDGNCGLFLEVKGCGVSQYSVLLYSFHAQETTHERKVFMIYVYSMSILSWQCGLDKPPSAWYWAYYLVLMWHILQQPKLCTGLMVHQH